MLAQILRHLRRRFIEAPRGSGHWRRLGRFFTIRRAITTTNGVGDKTWDIRILLPVTARGAPRP